MVALEKEIEQSRSCFEYEAGFQSGPAFVIILHQVAQANSCMLVRIAPALHRRIDGVSDNFRFGPPSLAQAVDEIVREFND